MFRSEKVADLERERKHPRIVIVPAIYSGGRTSLTPVQTACALDSIEKSQELLMPMSRLAFTDHGSF
jgi:hypothetical protein